MSEYTNVERPFLEKLREIGWKVIDKIYGVKDEKFLEKYKNIKKGLKKLLLKGENINE